MKEKESFDYYFCNHCPVIIINVHVSLFLFIHIHTDTHTAISNISLSAQCGVIKALVRGILKCQVREGGREGGREG